MEEEKRAPSSLDLDFSGRKGVSRRDFLKYCGLVTAALGLDSTFIPKVAQALTAARPPIVWLNFASCTGCTESFLRSSNPLVSDIILGTLSVEYHESLMAASGDAATSRLKNALTQYAGQFICVCEGAIPTADNGIYGMIGNKTMLQIAEEVCSKAKAVICLGSCASFGGMPASAGNQTGTTSVHAALGGFPTINISGCPPNPVNLVATITNYLLTGTFPELDSLGRPVFAYGNTVHSGCSRVGTTTCLKPYGCRGTLTYNNCPTVKFNEAASWPVQADAPCYGCSMPDFFDKGSFYDYSGSS